MWVVRHGDDLYVRSVNGRGSSWFRGARNRHEARICTGGIEKHVSLVEADAANDPIDAAYHAKYNRRYASIVPSIVAAKARAAALKLVPREEEHDAEALQFNHRRPRCATRSTPQVRSSP